MNFVDSRTMVEFSPAEASDLAMVLSEVAREDESRFSQLSVMCERLSDSLWLSGWKRDNVNVELDMAMRLETIAALEEVLRQSDPDDNTVRFLEKIVDRLTSADPSSERAE